MSNLAKLKRDNPHIEWSAVEDALAADMSRDNERTDRTVFIPENEYGIEESYYSMRALGVLAAANVHRPAVLRFIADMVEE